MRDSSGSTQIPFRDRWSVRAHLIAIVSIAVLVFASFGAFLTRSNFRAARAKAVRGASFEATLAAKTIAESLASAKQGIADSAAGPGLAAAFEQFGQCSLTSTGDAIFPTGHLDLLTTSGAVGCSSLAKFGAPKGATHAGTAWVAKVNASKGVIVSDIYQDSLDSTPSIAIAAPVFDQTGKRLGSFAQVVAIKDGAASLSKALGGPDGFRFTILDRSKGIVVSSSSYPGRVGAPLQGTQLASLPASGESVALDATADIYGSKAVTDSTWVVYAGIDKSKALAAAWLDVRQDAMLALAGLGVTLLLGFFFYCRIARPLRRLTAAVEQSGRQVTPPRVTVEGPSEIARLVTEFNETVAMRAAYETRLTHLTFHDDLTGLPNRVLFLDHLHGALRKAGGNPASVAVLFADIDRFKLVNETVSHQEGDRIIGEVAKRLVAVLRPGDTIARFGHDEFAILSDSPVSVEQAAVIGQRIQSCLATPFDLGSSEITLTASVGIAFGRDNVSAEELLRDADAAMARARAGGLGRVEFYDESLRVRAKVRLDLERDLRRALERRELRLDYQPQVDMKTGAIFGVEALLRWEPEGRTAIPPADFISIAEETDLILPIGAFVLDEACKQAAKWNVEGHLLKMSVNISVRQLMHPDLAVVVARALVNAGLPPSQLCLEITESALMEEFVSVTEMLARLKALGVEISIDDFGTGYSSLAYLQRFPVDQLKVDRSFVSGLGTRTGRSALVGAIVDMAHALDLEVVAEGVEEAAQVVELQRLGCASGQGFLFAIPQGPEMVSSLLGSGVMVPAVTIRPALHA